ncbi:hypothetical protein, partial [Plasmodium yoelii yoelii]
KLILFLFFEKIELPLYFLSITNQKQK